MVVGRVPTGAATAGQRPVSGIEMDDHLAVILVFAHVEGELPAMGQ